MAVHNASRKVELDDRSDGDPILGRSYPDVASTLHVAVERLFRIVRDEFAEFLKQSGNLKLQEWRVLTALFANGPMPQKDIVRAVVMEQAQVSRALSEMQRSGLVIARRRASDRRSWRFSLSGEGHRLYERMHPAAIARKTALDAVLTEEEKTHFFACLRKIASHALDEKVQDIKLTA